MRGDYHLYSYEHIYLSSIYHLSIYLPIYLSIYLHVFSCRDADSQLGDVWVRYIIILYAMMVLTIELLHCICIRLQQTNILASIHPSI